MTDQAALFHQIPRGISDTDSRGNPGEPAELHGSRNTEMNRQSDRLPTHFRDPSANRPRIERHLCRHPLHVRLLGSKIAKQDVWRNRRVTLGIGGDSDLVEVVASLEHAPDKRGYTT